MSLHIASDALELAIHQLDDFPATKAKLAGIRDYIDSVIADDAKVTFTGYRPVTGGNDGYR